jgi:hypothetical protein
MPSARQKVSRIYRKAISLEEMPSIFNRKAPTDASVAPLLDRFHATGLPADRDALILHLLPLAGRLANSHHKAKFTAKTLDELDVLASDACIALFDAVERYHALPVSRFMQLVMKVVSMGFAVGYGQRHGRRLLSDKHRLLGSFAKRFARQHGRTPTDDERQAYLATIILNPDMLVSKPRKKQIAFSAIKAEGLSESRCDLFTDRRNSLAPMIDQDVMAFAKQSFTGVDLEIFLLAVDGVGATEVGRRLGISKSNASMKMNAVLWQARCRADLARALGVEPADGVPLNRLGNPRSIRSVPPARMVG